MNPESKEDSASPADDIDVAEDFDSALAAQFGVLEKSVDAEAKSDAKASVHAWRDHVERRKLESEIEVLREKIRAQAETREMRRSYASKALGLAQVALVFWIFMFTMTATVNLVEGRGWLSDTALVSLTAGATVNVVAVFLVVVQGLFKAALKKSDEDNSGV